MIVKLYQFIFGLIFLFGMTLVGIHCFMVLVCRLWFFLLLLFYLMLFGLFAKKQCFGGLIVQVSHFKSSAKKSLFLVKSVLTLSTSLTKIEKNNGDKKLNN